MRFARRVRRYRRTFSWPQILLFKLSDILAASARLPSMRQTRALRLLAYLVPPDRMTVHGGEYRFSYSVNGVGRTFALRRGSSDVEVFLQVIRDEEYAGIARMAPKRPRPRRIIDAGANVGLATLYFKSVHADAQVIALEPEPGNFEMLSRCILANGLRDVSPLKQGIWARDTGLAPERSFRGGEAWSFALREAARDEEGPIPAICLESLLSKAGWDYVDLLKLDIEGGEARLLRDRGFLETVRDRVGLLCMEVHEEAISRVEARAALASVGMTTVGPSEGVVAWRSRS